MPNSKNDTDAFVYKYKSRPADQIIYAMQKDSSPTIEHIREFSIYKSNNQGNLMAMCKDCNETRGILPYDKFIEMRPEMKRNIYKYFEDCEKILRTDTLSSDDKKYFKHYISKIRKTLFEVTKGALKQNKKSS